MSIKAICDFFDRRPVRVIDKDVKFFLFSPINEVGIYFSDEDGLRFDKFVDQSPNRQIPPVFERNSKAQQTSLAPTISDTAPKFVRVIYFAFLGDGDILTVSFQTKYTGTNLDRDWAIKKCNQLNKFKANPRKIIDYFDADNERISRGLDQDFSSSSLIFFYVCNRHMEFYKEKFSCVAVPGNPEPHKNPFIIIASTDSNFFGLYNIFDGAAVTVVEYQYKFNLHMKTKGYLGDVPQLIPFIIDPEFGNKGPPN